jgi:hypothetical protein
MKERENTFQSLAKEYSKSRTEKMTNSSKTQKEKLIGKISYFNYSIKEYVKEKIVFFLRLWAMVVYAFITFWTELTYKCLGLILKTKSIFIDYPIRVFYYMLDKFFFNPINWVSKKLHIYK